MSEVCQRGISTLLHLVDHGQSGLAHLLVRYRGELLGELVQGALGVDNRLQAVWFAVLARLRGPLLRA